MPLAAFRSLVRRAQRAGALGAEADAAADARADDEARIARIAHLCYVAQEADRVSVEVVGETVHGVLGAPANDGATLPFRPQRAAHPHGRVPDRLPARTPLIVRYGRGEDRYRFVSEVLAAPPGAPWRLWMPTRIQSTCRRRAVRKEVQGDWRVRVQPDAAGPLVLPVRDISATGLQFVMDTRRMSLQVDQELHADVAGPDGVRLRPTLRVRHLTPSRTREHIARVGCSFGGLDVAEIRALTQRIEDWPEVG